MGLRLFERVVLLLLALLVATVFLIRIKPASGHKAIPQARYIIPRRVLWATQDGAVLVPWRFAAGANTVVKCESQWDAWAIGDDGLAHGLFQIRTDFHAERMGNMGLTLTSPRDQLWYAVRLWYDNEWDAWACRP